MVQQSLNVAYSDGSSQVLWEDGERVFSRGWRLDDNGNRLAVLLVAPAADHPSRSRLDRLTHEYELKDELDGAWAVRPLALMRDAGRTVLVLDDPGGEPLDRLLGWAHGGGTLLAPGYRCYLGSGQASSARAHPQRHQASQYCGGLRGWTRAAHRVWHRIAPVPRAAGARAARDHRRYACLHGTRTDRADEPLDRCPQRSLRARRHALPDAHGRSALHGGRSHGVGALPYCQKAGAAKRAVRECPSARLGDHHEAARQDTPRIVTRPPPVSSAICGAALPNGKLGAASTTSRSANTTRRTGC